jgi:hypothetical protein
VVASFDSVLIIQIHGKGPWKIAADAIMIDKALPCLCYALMPPDNHLRYSFHNSSPAGGQAGFPHSSRPRRNTIGVVALFTICLFSSARAQLYVVNRANGTIGKYSVAGVTINPAFISGLRSPTGLAIAEDYLYVAEEETGTIKQFTTSGTLVNSALITGLSGPWGIAVSGGYLYVANTGRNPATIGKYTLAGVPVNPALVGGLGYPIGLEVEGDYLYVSEWQTGRVGKYTVEGATVNASLISGLFFPGGLALDGNGNLFLSTLQGGVRLYTTSGAGGASVIPGAYNSGIGLALDQMGNLFYANNFGGAGGNRIGKYTTSGQVLNASLITGLANPVAIVVVPEIPTNRPPQANAGIDQAIECPGRATFAQLDGGASTDANGDTLSYTWSEGGAVIGYGAIANVPLATGIHLIRLVVIDPSGESSEDFVAITVQDTTPPQIVNLTATPSVVWPNGQMVSVTIQAEVADTCDNGASARIISVNSNEPITQGRDWRITGPLSLDLRASLVATHRRSYIIGIVTIDGAGNTSRGSVSVVVRRTNLRTSASVKPSSRVAR